MSVLVETMSGSPFEMGRQHGHIFRHEIRAAVANTVRHSFEESDAELDAALAPVRASHVQFAPWLPEEWHGIASGSGVPIDRIERLHLRVWNVVPRTFLAAPSCTSLGIRTEDAGVVVAGNLDDPRRSYALLRRQPRAGLAHVMITWIGAAWGHNGLNDAGLAVAQSSLGGYTPPLRSRDSETWLRGSLATRLLLQQCRDVPEALGFLKAARPESSFVLGDSAGRLVACQCLGGCEPVVQQADDHDGLVFSTNHIHMPALVARLAAAGSRPDVAEHSAVRYAALERVRATLPRRLDEVVEILRSHDGWPHSVCRDATAFSTYAAPQRRPAALHVADRPPCNSPYTALPVGPETMPPA